MSRLTELINKTRAQDPELAAELEREYRTLAGRRSFGLNFERHQPEAVELPNRPVRKGDKVRVLPERGSTTRGDRRLWLVQRVEKVDGVRHAHLRPLVDDETEPVVVAADDLVVVAEFKDPIYPGLTLDGTVARGGDKPFHTVINAENFHALKALTFTHRGKVDAIYIDPPYNTGAKDWKYNNDYVEGDDLYRHSKWLAFMERRLLLARELLNPDDSVLIVTIDEKEVHRLAILLEQTFQECDIQTVTTVTNPAGSLRTGRFTRVEEYIFFVFVGRAVAGKWTSRMLDGAVERAAAPTLWFTAVRRGGGGALRANRTTPVLFYPVYLNATDGSLHSIGDPLPADQSTAEHVRRPPGTVAAVAATHETGREANRRFSGDQMRARLEAGTARLGKRDLITGLRSITYLQPGTLKRIEAGELEVVGRTAEGALELAPAEGFQAGTVPPAAVWRMRSHFARDYGTGVLKALLTRGFPFPKSLYAVEDSLRVAVVGKPHAVVLDFFSGSGTTAHAVMRLNRQDGGRRQCISVTNNEVSADEQRKLRESGVAAGGCGVGGARDL